MAIYSIYKFTNLVNGKVYIGKTTKEPKTRYRAHAWSAKSGSEYAVHRAIRKYGIDQFQFEVIDTSATTTEEHNRLEIHFINEFNSFSEQGYNMRRGGDGADSESARMHNLKRIAEGNHNWAGAAGSAKQKARIESGTHNFHGERGSALQRALIEAGTHHSQVLKTCPHCQKSGKAPGIHRWHFNNCSMK